MKAILKGVMFDLMLGLLITIGLFIVLGSPNTHAAEGHPACASCHEEKGISQFNILPKHMMVPFCGKCHVPTEEKAPDHPPLHDEEIPPEIMKQLRERVLNEAIERDQLRRVPNVSGHPEHVQRVCMDCHGDLQAMAQAADGVLTDEEMFLHTLFAWNVNVFKPMGLPIVMIVPTNGVDVVTPVDVCLLSRTAYPEVSLEIVYQHTAAGKNIKYKCPQLHPASLRW